jgi:hypothetical protein
VHEFGSAGWHKLIASHVAATPVASFGHGIVALHATLHTWKPGVANSWQTPERQSCSVLHGSNAGDFILPTHTGIPGLLPVHANANTTANATTLRMASSYTSSRAQ